MSDLFAGTEHAPVLLFGTSKGWIPSEYMDEVCPEPRPTPSDWLIADPLKRLAPGDDGPEAAPGRLVRNGDVVKFDELVSYPNVRAVWNGPGDWKLLSPYPAGATCFCLLGDPDTVGYSLDDFMRDNGEMGSFEPGEEFEINAFDWSTHEFVLREGRFEAAESPAVARA